MDTINNHYEFFWCFRLLWRPLRARRRESLSLKLDTEEETLKTQLNLPLLGYGGAHLSGPLEKVLEYMFKEDKWHANDKSYN